MSVEVNFVKDDNWFRGEDKTLEFTVFQPDGTTPQNITGWTLAFTFCDLQEVTKFTKTTPSASGITITNPTGGVLEVFIPDTDTELLDAGKFKHELRRTDPGLEATLAHGGVLLQKACS